MCGGYTGEHEHDALEVTYVDYQFKINPKEIQFSDTGPDKLTMDQLVRHGLTYGDTFVLTVDKEGQVCLKKEGNEWVKMDGKWTRIMSEEPSWSI